MGKKPTNNERTKSGRTVSISGRCCNVLTKKHTQGLKPNGRTIQGIVSGRLSYDKSLALGIIKYVQIFKQRPSTIRCDLMTLRHNADISLNAQTGWFIVNGVVTLKISIYSIV